MTALRKQQIFEQSIYIGIIAIIFIAPIINTLWIAYQTDRKIDITQHMIKMWMASIPFFILFLLNNYILIPFLLLKKRYAGYIVALTFTIFLLFVFLPELAKLFHQEQFMHRPPHRIPLANALTHPLEGIMAGGPLPPFLSLTPILIGLLLVGFNVAVRLFMKSIHDDKKLNELEHQQLKTELQYLKYQLNPHFFMNTLNNIHTLIDLNTEKAKKSIIELSKLMRYMLYEADKNSVPLSKEIEFLEHFLILMQLRYTDKLHVQKEFPFVVPDMQVPPMLFISLLENAFKHGVSYRNDSFIQVNLSIKEGKIFFTCKNRIHATTKKQEKGIGLANVQKRLAILFGNNYTLTIDKDNNLFSILLIIPAL